MVYLFVHSIFFKSHHHGLYMFHNQFRYKLFAQIVIILIIGAAINVAGIPFNT